MSPVRRHLPSMRIWIGFSAHAFQKHFKRRHAKLQTQRAIAIVGIEPVVTRFQAEARGRQNRFMTGAADLKEDPVLPLHLDLFVVHPPRHVHRAEDLQHFFRADLSLLLSLRFAAAPHRLNCRSSFQNRRRRRRFRLSFRDGLCGEGRFRQSAFGFLDQS